MKNATIRKNSEMHFHHLKKMIVIVLPLLLFFLSSTAQNYPPDNTSCTSKDLEIVDARLKDPCKTCEIGKTTTRELEIGIGRCMGGLDRCI